MVKCLGLRTKWRTGEAKRYIKIKELEEEIKEIEEHLYGT